MAPQIEAPDRLRYREGGFALAMSCSHSSETAPVLRHSVFVQGEEQRTLSRT